MFCFGVFSNKLASEKGFDKNNVSSFIYYSHIVEYLFGEYFIRRKHEQRDYVVYKTMLLL